MRDSGKSPVAQGTESQREVTRFRDGFNARYALVPDSEAGIKAGQGFPLSGGATVRTTAPAGSPDTGAAF